jgi:hypothetical protein
VGGGGGRRAGCGCSWAAQLTSPAVAWRNLPSRPGRGWQIAWRLACARRDRVFNFEGVLCQEYGLRCTSTNFRTRTGGDAAARSCASLRLRHLSPPWANSVSRRAHVLGTDKHTEACTNS